MWGLCRSETVNFVGPLILWSRLDSNVQDCNINDVSDGKELDGNDAFRRVGQC